MHVYFIAGENYAHTGYFKVGVSKSYRKRVKQISSNVPFGITTYCAIDCEDESTALRIEQQVLREFKEYRIKGEWFFAYGRNIQHESNGFAKAVTGYLESLGYEVLKGR